MKGKSPRIQPTKRNDGLLLTGIGQETQFSWNRTRKACIIQLKYSYNGTLIEGVLHVSMDVVPNHALPYLERLEVRHQSHVCWNGSYDAA